MSVPIVELGVGIGGGVGALFLVVIIAVCFSRMCKSSSPEALMSTETKLKSLRKPRSTTPMPTTV